METNTEELERQREYIQKVKTLNKKGAKMFIQTFGCQMNAHDSEKLKGMLVEMGYEEAEDEKSADLIVYNTCCVRENAENKVYGNLGFLKSIKEENKDLKIVLCGCMMQQDTVIEKLKKTYRHVDVIFGTFNLYRFPQLLYTNLETKQMIIDVWQEQQEIIEDLPMMRANPFKASINIMYGCNNFCSYCIVPYVRGRERSRVSKDILEEAVKLAQGGVKEITLLGQNVNSYGKNLDENIDFAGLLELLTKVNGIERIRFMTSHPKDLSDSLVGVIRDYDKICKHIHLPFQSGSSRILEKMNRRYTKEEYLALAAKIKSEIPGVTLSTDIIVGFPGETEEDFQDTLDVVREVKFSSVFTFIYSKRTGTPAASYDNQIGKDAVKDRFERLLETVNPIIYELNSGYAGKTVKVLAEGVSAQDPGFITGRTDTNALVHFQADESCIGKILDIEITGNKTFYLNGRIKN